eukprot:TRINITY_DN6586_c0_g2_i1.p2 TRINITY_DN6586_c0_g2~~TRINITY_DN6586_c0_g2_i1.p2  ORF type:complete len:226 (+),score=51.90 TRINITY_DN6586_c0_g2_i1:1510-2187(+)
MASKHLNNLGQIGGKFGELIGTIDDACANLVDIDRDTEECLSKQQIKDIYNAVRIAKRAKLSLEAQASVLSKLRQEIATGVPMPNLHDIWQSRLELSAGRYSDQAVTAALQDSNTVELLKTVTMGDDEDDDIAVSQVEINLECPLTQRLYEKPLKSTICGHVYDDSASLRKILKTKKRCPDTKCHKKDTPQTINDWKLDKRTLKRVQRRKEEQEMEDHNVDSIEL